MIAIREIYSKISNRDFELPDARKLIKTSYYFAGKHPDVHIVLTGDRPADLHIRDEAAYGQRSRHSMFLSMDDAAGAIAGALNCAAGEAAMRFLSISSVRKVCLYSRSGADQISQMTVRSALGASGAQTGTMWSNQTAKFVVVVLGIHAEQVVLTTAYPCRMLPETRPEPPAGADLLEYANTQVFSFPVG